MSTQTAELTKWNIDNAHSEITFKVRHMMIASVTGKFEKFNATAATNGEDIAGAQLHFEAEVASVNTNAEDRDKHLRSADFFDAENHAKLTFESTKVTAEKVIGNLTIKGNTNEVELQLENGGTGIDPWGNKRIGLTVSGKINRKNWGLNWNAALETGGVLVSDEVALNCEIQFVQEK